MAVVVVVAVVKIRIAVKSQRTVSLVTNMIQVLQRVRVALPHSFPYHIHLLMVSIGFSFSFLSLPPFLVVVFFICFCLNILILMPLCDGFSLSGKLKALFRIKHSMLFMYVRLEKKKTRNKYIYLIHTQVYLYRWNWYFVHRYTLRRGLGDSKAKSKYEYFPGK